MNEKQTTVQVEGWGIVRFPTRWLDLNAMQWDVHALDADHILAPGCVDLSCLDSIHALANLIFDLREEGYLNRQAAEAFNPALAPKPLGVPFEVCPCGHSACCQNFIDTGDAGCIEGGE
tara:strand:+ start:4137 stop:4493 length:357 start_codon:yes stop_codon:yes gene_type:complete